MFRLASGEWDTTICDAGESTGCDANDDNEADANEIGSKNQGPWMTYMHGTPDAPDGFAYAMSGTTHLFTWESTIPRSPNQGGVKSYWLRWTSGDATLAATKWTEHGKAIEADFYKLSATQTKALKDGEMYTFELTTLGMSSSLYTKQEQSSDPVSVMVPIGMVPTPTLPELAALFLALLLLGSGAYLLRGRQLGGLTRA